MTGRLPAPRSQKQPDDQTREVETREREPWQTRVITPWERQGRSQQYSIQKRNWKTQPTWNLNSFLKERRHWIRQWSTVRPRGARKANPQSETEHKRLSSTWTERVRHNRPGERKRSPVAKPSDDPSTRERDEWKARTRIEADSKAPSASIASSTCRKAGARGKHTQNVVTTPGSVRGEEKSLEQVQGNRPEERMSLQDSASNARYRYCGSRATPKLKEDQPVGKSHSSSPSIVLGVTKTPKEKDKGKTGGKLPSRRSN